MRKCFFIVGIIFSLLLIASTFSGCSSWSDELTGNEVVMIGEKEYDSLAEAIIEAKAGDCILVFNDVVESQDNEYVESLKNVKYNDNLYVSYVINKPITIKGVDTGGEKPKIYGTFICELIDDEYMENNITIDNLDIVHGYVGGDSRELNKGFLTAVEILNGSVNVVNNNISANYVPSNDSISVYDLDFASAVSVMRRKDEELANNKFVYDIMGNSFSGYVSMTEKGFSSAVKIIEEDGNAGTIMPCSINGQTNNFALTVFKENKFKNVISHAYHYNNEEKIFKSMAVKDQRTIDFEKVKDEDSRIYLNNDLSFDENTIIDIYGVMVVDGKIRNAEFELKTENAKIIITEQDD